MKIKDAEILIIPGNADCGPDHWLTRWQEKMQTARRVEQVERPAPQRDDWVNRIRGEISRSEKPVVLIGHSLGVAAAVHAVRDGAKNVRGGFFVAPPDVSAPQRKARHLAAFGPYPRDPMPFPSFVVASRNDPFSTFEQAEEIASAWGSFLVDAGESGHIDTGSGHGPWPEGLMVFAEFMKRL